MDFESFLKVTSPKLKKSSEKRKLSGRFNLADHDNFPNFSFMQPTPEFLI
jgi:Ca2+-binding EF-hand superfamily protein